jgi:hypothetical protein
LLLLQLGHLALGNEREVSSGQLINSPEIRRHFFFFGFLSASLCDIRSRGSSVLSSAVRSRMDNRRQAGKNEGILPLLRDFRHTFPHR